MRRVSSRQEKKKKKSNGEKKNVVGRIRQSARNESNWTKLEIARILIHWNSFCNQHHLPHFEILSGEIGQSNVPNQYVRRTDLATRRINTIICIFILYLNYSNCIWPIGIYTWTQFLGHILLYKAIAITSCALILPSNVALKYP